MGLRHEYSTRPRERIAELLRSERRFLSAGDIHGLLGSGQARVALSTVYRTLEHWLSKGEVTARVDPQGESTFMLCAPQQQHHHHAICNACGRVEDVGCEAIDRIAESLRGSHGFELSGHAMEFFGRCRACR